MKNLDVVRVTFNCPKSVYDKIMDYCKEIGINTTSAILVLLTQALDQKYTMPFSGIYLYKGVIEYFIEKGEI